MENVQKQKTLGYFVFTKKVGHFGKEQEVKIPNFTDAEEAIKLISSCIFHGSPKVKKELAFTLNAKIQGKFY